RGKVVGRHSKNHNALEFTVLPQATCELYGPFLRDASLDGSADVEEWGFYPRMNFEVFSVGDRDVGLRPIHAWLIAQGGIPYPAFLVNYGHLCERARRQRSHCHQGCVVERFGATVEPYPPQVLREVIELPDDRIHMQGQ